LPLPQQLPPPPPPQQHPSSATDGDLGASELSQTTLSEIGLSADILAAVSDALNQDSTGLSGDLLGRITDALDRNTKVLDLVTNHLIRGQHGATIQPIPSPVVQTPAKDADEAIPTGKPTKMFRRRARTVSRKNANELQHRVRLPSLSKKICYINILQKHVRAHANKMLGRTRGDKIETLRQVPNETAFKYKSTGKEEDGPSVDLFQPDFSERCPENSPWNIRMAEIFADDYIKKGLPFDQLRDLSNYFLTYLRTLKTTHRKMATDPSGEGTVYERASKCSRIQSRKLSVRVVEPSSVQR